MHFTTSLSVILLPLLGLQVSAEATGNKYERRAIKNLVAGQLCADKCLELKGWCPLPPKASYSQCALALDRIAKQPQSCAMKYLSGIARNVYSPIYPWFVMDDNISGDNIVLVAQQFALDNSVAVQVYDPFSNQIANISEEGTILTIVTGEKVDFSLARTWALNYPTFVRNEEEGLASIAQNVWSDEGELITVIIFKPINVLPVVC